MKAKFQSDFDKVCTTDKDQYLSTTQVSGILQQLGFLTRSQAQYTRSATPDITSGGNREYGEEDITAGELFRTLCRLQRFENPSKKIQMETFQLLKNRQAKLRDAKVEKMVKKLQRSHLQNETFRPILTKKSQELKIGSLQKPINERPKSMTPNKHGDILHSYSHIFKTRLERARKEKDQIEAKEFNELSFSPFIKSRASSRSRENLRSARLVKPKNYTAVKTSEQVDWEKSKTDCTFTPKLTMTSKTVQSKYTAQPKHFYERPAQHLKFKRAFADLPKTQRVSPPA